MSPESLLHPLLLLVLIIAAVSAYRHGQPCPHGCRCSSSGGYDRHRWHRLLAAYRTRRIVYGDRRAGTTWRPSRAPRTQEGREMTCLGLSTMPDYIPTDVSKLTLYGDSKTTSLQQDSPAGEFSYGNHGDSGSHSSRKYHQLTAISKYSFRSARGIAEVSIEGNRIKVIHPNEFDMLSDMRKLMLRNNRLKLIWVRAFKGLEKLEVLDLSKNHIRRLSKGVFNDVPNVKKLYLNKNRLRGLHTRLFRKMRKLEVLDVSDNFVKALHQDLFSQNPNMRELVVDNNNIMHIRPEWFQRMAQLTRLSLRGNRIYTIQRNAFQHLASLKHLNLAQNEVSTIPDGAFTDAKNLHSLSLSHNNISVVTPGAFQDAENLKNLDLSENRIADLGNDTFIGLTNLDTLSLAKNHLLGMNQAVVTHTKKLTHLDLSHNKIKIIKTMNFFGLLELRELKLDHNQIRVIEEEGFAVSLVNTYSKLTWLYLQYNQLGTVTSRMLYGLSYLKFLNLCHNQIGEVEEGGLSMVGRLHTLVINDNRIGHMDVGLFKHLRHLRHLNLASNDLHDLAFNVFLGLDNVEDISLQNNPIHDIPVGAFQDTPRLITLNLKKNKLRRFDLEVLETATRLKYLDLSRNAISKLHMPKQFRGNLYFLSLADNHLETLPVDITETLTRGASIHLYGNPWSCDCELGWIRDVYLGSRFKLPEHDEIACKSPSTLAGEQVLSLRPEFLQCWPRDQPAVRRVETSTISCSFMGHAKHTNTREHVKARKSDLLDWYATFLTPNQTLHCTGVLLDEDWILTSSACWKFYSDASLLLRIGQKEENNIAREVIIDQVVHYPGSLDIALVKIFAASDTISQRIFPCVLSEEGTQQALRKRMHGILETRKVHLRHAERMKIKPLPYRIIDSPSSTLNTLRIRGPRQRMSDSKEVISDAPFFVKVGISRWAFVGFNKRVPALSTDSMVSISYPAIRWIDRLLF